MKVKGGDRVDDDGVVVDGDASVVGAHVAATPVEHVSPGIHIGTSQGPYRRVARARTFGDGCPTPAAHGAELKGY